MNENRTSGNLHIRGFISLLTALSFIIMTVSGIILFIVPQGRIANWHDWHFLALTKGQWGDMHISTSLLFILAGLWHTWINWRALLGYFRNRQRKTLQLKPELVMAVLATVFFTLGAVYKIPPVSYVLTLNDAIKQSWIRGPQDEPIVSHAEGLPFATFVQKADIELDAALAELQRQGLRITSPNEKLADIARNNQTSPAGVYTRIEHLQKKTEAARWTPERVEERFEGKGTGKRTLSEICSENGLDNAAIVLKLAGHSIDAKPEETLKQIAERSGRVPMDVLKLVLAGEATRP
jgi:hypothetical protein